MPASKRSVCVLTSSMSNSRSIRGMKCIIRCSAASVTIGSQERRSKRDGPGPGSTASPVLLHEMLAGQRFRNPFLFWLYA